MQSNLRELRKRRRYSEEFKRKLVKEFESGTYSVLQLEQLYGVSNVSVYNWIYKYSTFNEKGYRVVEKQDSKSDKLNSLVQRIEELERIVGQKQIKIDYLEQLISLSSEELGVDIKKNSATQHLNGSESIKSK